MNVMDSTPHSTPVPDPRYRRKLIFADTAARRALVSFGRFLFTFFMELDVSGLEHLPAQGAVILAANHVTNFDVFPVQFALPRPIFFMAKANLFKFLPMDLLLRNLGAFPVNRGEKDAWAMRHAAQVLNHGQALGMFPEGTRSTGRGLAVAKTGTARLALEANCPILPVAITGSDQFFKRFARRARVRVVILPPLFPEPGENPLALTDRLMFTLAQGLPVEMRGVYADLPEGFEE